MHALIKPVQLAPALPVIEALHTSDHLSGAAIRSLCQFLSISSPSQLNRIRRQPDLAAALHFVTIDTTTGPRAVAMLEGYAIAIWASGLQTKHFSAEKQNRVAILKRDAFAVIQRAFSAREMADTGPETVPNREQQAIPAQNLFDRIIAGMEDMLEGFTELRADYATQTQRILMLEQANLGGRTTVGASMSTQQIGEIFLQLRLLRDRTGFSVEDAEKTLAAQFNVTHITDINAAQWAALQQAIRALFNNR
jgi:hypothetical protein